MGTVPGKPRHMVIFITDCQVFPDRQGKLGSKTYSFSSRQVVNMCHTALRDMGHATGEMTELCTMAKLYLVCIENGTLGLAKDSGEVRVVKRNL